MGTSIKGFGKGSGKGSGEGSGNGSGDRSGSSSRGGLARPAPPVRNVLARLLDEPALVAEVRALPPAALTKLIDHVGLEDAGEIVALATTEQIASVFDEDLWTREAPGEDEAFDPERFVTWLQILLEAGEGAAARRLSELDPDTVTYAFHRLAHVIVTDELASEIAEGIHEDGEEIERALEGALSHEIGEYMLVARQHEGWDAIVQAVVALDELDHDACARLLDRMGALTERAADEEGGLHQVLSEAESLADDVIGDRNERRAKEGFLAASDARAFLRLAREAVPTPGERDAVTKAYFRELDRAPRPAVAPSRLMTFLDRAGITRPAKRPKALGHSPLARAMSDLPPARQAELMEELAYLVNVLLAGDSRPWRPAEAAEAVVSVIESALGAAGARRGKRERAVDLAKESLVQLFRAGVHDGRLDELPRLRRQ